MSKGSLYPSESREFRDSQTGARMRQVTSHPSIHHHPFYYLPAWDNAMRHLVFVSYRTGAPQLFLEIRETGQLLQLTERGDLNATRNFGGAIQPRTGQRPFGARRARFDAERQAIQ